MSTATTPSPFQKIYLEPENRVFAEIMSNGKIYQIPRFQRDYAWEQDQWDALWTDITDMINHRTQHFMGYLVFQTQDNKYFHVIDGQQRLTTVSLILLAGLNRLQNLAQQAEPEEAENNNNRIALYKKTYIDVIDPVSLRTLPKLVLNRHNKNHFRDISQSLDINVQRNLTKTNRKIIQGFSFFKEKFQTYTSGKQIAETINDIADGLLFTTITVTDDLNAYTVFETLNARGLHLSTPDLLKNDLLAKLAADLSYTEHDFDDFDEQWAAILQQLGETEFTAFLRSHTGMSQKIPNKAELYRILKSMINQPGKVFPYLTSLKQQAAVYAALQNRQDDFWKEPNGQYTEVRQHLQVFDLFKIKTPLSVLMAGYAHLSAADFIKLVKRIAVLTIRYNIICRKPAKEQELVYNKMANKLTNQQANLYDITQDLLTIYPEDKIFRHTFTEKTMPSRQSPKKILFLLRAIEGYLSGEQLPLTLTLEHILPYKPIDTWQADFGRDNYNNAIDRLGNMALLPKTKNMGQERFSEKQTILQTSPYHINRHIAEYPTWNIDNLQDHQQWLAAQATVVWRIND